MECYDLFVLRVRHLSDDVYVYKPGFAIIVYFLLNPSVFSMKQFNLSAFTMCLPAGNPELYRVSVQN